MMNVLNV